MAPALGALDNAGSNIVSFDQAQSQKGFRYDKEGAITRPGLGPAESRLDRHVWVHPVASPDLQLSA